MPWRAAYPTREHEAMVRPYPGPAGNDLVASGEFLQAGSTLGFCSCSTSGGLRVMS